MAHFVASFYFDAVRPTVVFVVRHLNSKFDNGNLQKDVTFSNPSQNPGEMFIYIELNFISYTRNA